MLEYFSGEYDLDLAMLYCLLDELEIVSGSDRQKMYKMKKSVGGSALYGHTWKSYLSKTKNREPSHIYKGLYKTKMLVNYPWMEFVFKEFANLYFPSFEWTQVQINKNFPAPKHIDSSNVGTSILVCCGDYTGGRTKIWYDGPDKEPHYVDASLKPCEFNGSQYYHEVEPFECEVGSNRYSLVFFNNIKNLKDKIIKQIAEVEEKPVNNIEIEVADIKDNIGSMIETAEDFEMATTDISIHGMKKSEMAKVLKKYCIPDEALKAANRIDFLKIWTD